MLLCVSLLVICIVGSTAVANNEDNLASDSDKVKRFYSWEGGKRYDSEAKAEEKKADKRKFYAWAGKRSDDQQEDEENEVKGDVDKKKFYAWAGKRFDATAFKDPSKRKFYAWAGKRSMQDAADYYNGQYKRKFYAWAGKRDPNFDSLQMLKHFSDQSMHQQEPASNDKRLSAPKFGTWSG